MKILTPCKAALALALVWCAGCSTRSISNSSYEATYRYGHAADGYRGELSELDVVGVTPDATVTDADIAAALRVAAAPRLERNSRVLLIQSGADMPDEPMVAALNRHFRVLPFSGRPAAKPVGSPAFAKTLRFAAAQGGYDKIVCYWGVLESEQKRQATKVVSWVPIAGFFVPDEKENMRIRLKAVIIDVASGRWAFVTPPPAASSDFSSLFSRRDTDQDLVARLKQTGYENLVHVLLEDHTG